MTNLFKKQCLLIAIVFAILMVSNSYCLDLAMHMAIAKRTLQIWQSFDPNFYNTMTRTNNPTPYERWQQRKIGVRSCNITFLGI